MKSIKQLFLLSLPLLLLASCGKDDIGGEPGGGATPGIGGDIKFEIGFAPQTRVATGADFTSKWEHGDAIGIFAVKSGLTLTSGTVYDNIRNVKLTYTETTPGNPATGSWSLDPSVELWFPAGGGRLDFYAYYPYDATVTNPTAISFNVLADQGGTTQVTLPGGGTVDRPNYNLSDLLTAKSTGTGSTGWGKGQTVTLTFSHALAMVEVTVDDRVGALDINQDITVKLRGVQAGASLNLGANGGPEVTLPTTGNDPGNITMHRVADAEGYVYRALVPAQTLEQGASIFRIMSGDVLLNGSVLTDELPMIAGQAETFTQKTPVSALPSIKMGTFQMGSPSTEPNRQSNETQHLVTLTQDFYMSRYQITNAQYAAFLNAESIGPDGKWSSGDYSNEVLIKNSATEWSGSYNWGLNWSADKWVPVAGYEDHPVIYVTWYGAMSYCAWLTQTTGIKCSLPTEAQWEYACRGDYANKATETNTMPFGIGDGTKLYADMANFYGTYPYDLTYSGQISNYDGLNGHPNSIVGKTTVVGSYSYANSYGLYDMHGNVFEWCLDQCAWPIPDYGSSAVNDPVGTTGSSRVLRGGDWFSLAQFCRSAYRGYGNPDYARDAIGFRVVFVP